MPATISDAPSVSLSFANNFWGKDDAGLVPMLDRMHGAKVTSDELKSFYATRAAIEEDYARKLINLARKPLGSSETGTLRMSLDVVRGEVDAMGKAHQNVAQQMKTELDEQLTAFAGAMKERRKIVQGGIEKLHKTKSQQTAAVNKNRDRYEQDCLKIKGYLAQGHMVMGQEERKNKAKLEKTQIQLSNASNEYEAAIKQLEDTTTRWNKEWKVSCDKFQDLEEERLDFFKSSLWSFANIASTVCVSDDASCEKIRLSLEDCDVEKDIATFIRDAGTGQEIPDPPKFINFCREDASDAASEASADDNYQVAQFQRNINPAYRTSSPQPSVADTNSRGPPDDVPVEPRSDQFDDSQSATPKKATHHPSSRSISRHDFADDYSNLDEYPAVPYNEYPEDGMTQFCRMDQPSEISSAANSGRPSSRDSQSDYSVPTSFSSAEPSLISQSPTKPPEEPLKKRSGFFQSRSPFRRKSKGDKDSPKKDTGSATSSKRNTWGPQSEQSRRDEPPPSYFQPSRQVTRSTERVSASPEPVDPRANFQLNVGNNVFDVASPDARKNPSRRPSDNPDDADPIAQALAELKGIGKQASVRQSADRYHGIATPGPGSTTTSASTPQKMANRSAPPPSYNPSPANHLGAPQPAFTSRQMQQTTQRFIDQKQNMFNNSLSSKHEQGHNSHPSSQRSTPQAKSTGRASATNSRATSPSPYANPSSRASQYTDQRHGPAPRATSPSPYANSNHMQSNGAASYGPNGYNGNRPRSYSSHPSMPQNGNHSASVGADTGQGASGLRAKEHLHRAVSPQPQYHRLEASRSDMAMQLAPIPNQGPNDYGSYNQQPRGRPVGMHPGGTGHSRPVSQYGTGHAAAPNAAPPQRMRSRSVADGQKFTQDGKPILHFSRAMYMYQAAIPEELSFAKNDVLAVLRHQDDGWWEAEIVGKHGALGLVPSNYLQNC